MQQLNDYNSLLQVLSDAVMDSTGLIRVTFDLPDRRVELYSLDSIIKSIIDTNISFNLSKRLKWISPRPDSLALIEGLSSEYDLWKYSEYIDFAPEISDNITDIYRSVSLSTSLLVDRYLRFFGDSVKIYVESIDNKKLEELVSSWNYINLNVADFSYEVKSELDEAAVITDKLKIDIVEWKKQKIIGGDPSAIPSNEIENFLLDCSSKMDTLQDINDKGIGFSFVEILRNIEAGVETGLILIDPCDSHNEFSGVFDLASLDTESEFNPMQFEDWSEFDDDEEDFDNFSQKFSPTPYLLESIEVDVKKIMQIHLSNDSNKFKLFELLLENSGLIADVREIEGELRPKTKDYLEEMDKFEELRMQQSMSALDYDDDDNDESQLESLESDQEVLHHKQAVNAIFFSIEKLERKRFNLNEKRRETLEELQAVIPLKNDELTQQVHELIDKKIAGIDQVKNIAFNPDIPKNKDNTSPESGKVGIKFNKFKVPSSSNEGDDNG